MLALHYSQHAMATHCGQHVRAAMGKGTVGHVKYYPDHTFTLVQKVYLVSAGKPSLLWTRLDDTI
jgi:hypothetical protein